MKIKVTEKHIERGFLHNATVCPISLAIDDALRQKDIKNVYAVTTGYTVELVQTQTFELPQNVKDFIDRYDNEESVEPIEFELNNEFGTDEDEDLNSSLLS